MNLFITEEEKEDAKCAEDQILLLIKRVILWKKKIKDIKGNFLQFFMILFIFFEDELSIVKVDIPNIPFIPIQSKISKFVSSFILMLY